MFNRSSLYSLLLLFTFSCNLQDHPPQNGGDGPDAGRIAFMSSLMASGRYWRVEQLGVKVGDSTRNINFYPFTDAVDYVIATSVVPNSTYRFDSLIVDELTGGGPFGNVPYPTVTRMELTSLGLSNDGSWTWNDDLQTVELTLPGNLSSIISSASRSKFYPKKAILDNKVPPHFVTLGEAKTASEPGRISILVEEDDPKLGKVYYNLVLRSSWIIELDGGTPKVPVYKVHY